MLNATAQYSDIVEEGKVVSIERITTQAIRRNGCQNKRMRQRKLTRRRLSTSQDVIEMPAEAYMCPENAWCVGFQLRTNARSRQSQYLSCVYAAREEVDMQAQVTQEHLGFEIQPVDGRIWRDVSLVYISYALGNTRHGHFRMHTMSTERTCHVVCQEVQRQGTRVEFMLTLQLYTIVPAIGCVPNPRHAVYFNLCACTVKYIALNTAIRRMKHHHKSVVINAL